MGLDVRPEGVGRSNLDRIPGSGVCERCGEGVQAVPRLVLDRESPVESVIDDVHPGERELGADLVRHAGKDRDLEKGALFVLDCGVGNGRESGDGMQGPEPGNLRRCQAIVACIDHSTKRQGRIVD